MPQLPGFHFPGISIVDAVIAAVFLIQILWGAKLGFAPATFALAGEVLGLVIGILYANTIGLFLDQKFHFINQLSGFLSQRTHIPADLMGGFSTTLYEAIIFLIIFVVIQSGFFYFGKVIHHQVGVRRMTFFSNSFFGMIIGVIKATLEVVFFLIAWNVVTADPNIKTALNSFNGLAHITDNSILLPLFMHLVPASSPISKFFTG